MRLRVLGAYGSEAPGGKHPSAFLINERILLDAGCVTSVLNDAEQNAIENVLISHSHLDHVAGLGYLTEARILDGAVRPLTLCSSSAVIAAMRKSFFNNRVWPDFSMIPSAQAPVLRYRAMRPQVEHEVDGLKVTPVAVNHTVRTVGFVIREGEHSFVYSGDTGPTEALWQIVRKHREVRAAVIECSYPNRLGEIAEVAKHMTPRLLEREMAKLPHDLRVMIFHIKPQFLDETAAELRQINSERIIVLEQGRTYDIK